MAAAAGIVAFSAACATGPESIPRSKVTADLQVKAAEMVAELETALAAKDLIRAAELADAIDLADPYTPRNAMAIARARAAVATRDGNPRNYDDAMKRADSAVEAAPDEPDLRIARGRLQFDRKYYGKALEDFRRVTELRPGDRLAWRMIAFCHHHLREPKAERKAWESLLAISPDDADALYFLGAVLLRSADPTEVALGEEYLKRAVEKAPKHRLALESLAFRAWSRNDHVAAEDLLVRALTLSNASATEIEASSPAEAISGEASILYSLGAVRHSAGKLPEAADAYRQCLTFDPAHARASANLGTILVDLGEPDEGLRRLRDALLFEEDKDIVTAIEARIEAAEAALAPVDSEVIGPRLPNTPIVPNPAAQPPTTQPPAAQPAAPRDGG